MSDDHTDLADQADADADAMEQESDRIEGKVGDAKDALKSANSEQMIPHAMGDDDPGARPADDNDEDDGDEDER